MILPYRTAAEVAAAAPRAADHLRGGGLLAYPTETVYGLGCALLPEPLRRLAALKARDGGKPFLILVTGPEQAPGLEWTDAARRLAAAFWPGPLTLALAARQGAYPPEVVGPGGTVALRATSHPGARALLAALGGPVTSTSVNPPGGAPALDAERVVRALEALGAADDTWILDGGPLPPGRPSTIVDCSVAPPRVIRAGAVEPQALRRWLGEIDG